MLGNPPKNDNTSTRRATAVSSAPLASHRPASIAASRYRHQASYHRTLHGGAAHVQMRHDANQLRIEVRDDGPGMLQRAPAHHGKLSLRNGEERGMVVPLALLHANGQWRSDIV